MFLTKIKFIQDVVFESGRKSHKDRFAIKTKRYSVINHRKSKYDFKTHKETTVRDKIVEKTFVIFDENFEVNFDENLIIIVGDNGCGKTSFVKSIYLPKFERSIFSTKTDEEETRDYFSNYLKNENRVLSYSKYPECFINGKNIHANVFIDNLKNSKETLSGYDVLDLWQMKQNSNGENTLDFINSFKDIKNCLIILDEPETSLSIKSQIKIKKLFVKLSKHNQVIVVTHSPVIMESAKNVYDFEDKKYKNTKEYIASLYK